ncbi:MAG: hypothetical protein HKM04_06115 [Legionellales bacterium]|nr:hypothetical protein [Legionellales bacterium]
MNQLFLRTGLGIMLLFSSAVQAKNLGVIGEVFPIKEPDLLQEIHQKLTALQQSGQLSIAGEKSRPFLQKVKI